MRRLAVAALLASLSVAAGAQQRDLCAERPGLGTPACTVAPGHWLIETGLADWTREQDDTSRDDTVLIGDTLVRLGIGAMTEVQLGWTPYGHQRSRDLSTGVVDRVGRTGDVTIGMKQNLASPDGHGLSFALAPSVTLPVGRTLIGAGDWGATLVAPLTYDLSSAVQAEFTPEIDAAVDQDGRGRHLAYSGVIGLQWDVAEGFELVGEVQSIRDRDPAGHATMHLAGLSAAWQPGDHVQLDIGAAIGLNRAAPDLRLYTGIATLF